MFRDIKRICQSPTEGHCYWFPDIAGKRLVETLHSAMRDFRTSFDRPVPIAQVMRDFRLFTVLDDDRNNYLEIAAIHNEAGYRAIRQELSAQYNLSNHEPKHSDLERGPARRPLTNIALYPTGRAPDKKAVATC